MVLDDPREIGVRYVGITEPTDCCTLAMIVRARFVRTKLGGWCEEFLILALIKASFLRQCCDLDSI